MIGYDEKDEEHCAIAVGALCDSGTRASASSDSKIHDAQRWRSIGSGGQWTIFRVVVRMYGRRPYKVDLHERVFDAEISRWVTVKCDGDCAVFSKVHGRCGVIAKSGVQLREIDWAWRNTSVLMLG